LGDLLFCLPVQVASGLKGITGEGYHSKLQDFNWQDFQVVMATMGISVMIGGASKSSHSLHIKYLLPQNGLRGGLIPSEAQTDQSLQ